MCRTFGENWELVFLLLMRSFLTTVSVWGMLAMRRLHRAGQKLDFPIVPPSLVKLTSVFISTLLLSTVWVTITLFTSHRTLCAADGSLGDLTTMQRFIHGWSLAFSLACCLWIIVIGVKGYRHGPKVDKIVLDAIVEGMSKNPGLAQHGGVDACSE